MCQTLLWERCCIVSKPRSQSYRPHIWRPQKRAGTVGHTSRSCWELSRHHLSRHQKWVELRFFCLFCFLNTSTSGEQQATCNRIKPWTHCTQIKWEAPEKDSDPAAVADAETESYTCTLEGDLKLLFQKRTAALLFLFCLCKQTGKNENWTQCSPFEGNEGDLREKKCVSRKITMLSGRHWTLVPLNVFKVLLFTWNLNWFVTSPEMFNIQVGRICQIVIVWCHSSKGLATGCLLKWQSGLLR